MLCALFLGPIDLSAAQRSAGGLVVSDSAIASEVGAAIMRKGGNAIDAAIATGLALAVTFPAAGNIGGGGFMLIRMADGATVAIDYREVAPLAATKGMFLGPDGAVVEGASTETYRAAGVPGTVAGFAEAHRRFGKLAWRELVEPARRLAAEGFPLSHEMAESFRRSEPSFKKFPESRRVFNRDGRLYRWGEVWRQPELAATLARIRDRGSAGFYEGETARLVEEDMRRNGGLITREDLKSYRPAVREPLRGRYRGREVLTMPPPSSGGIALLQMLGILEGYDLRPLDWNSSEYLHLLVESMKRAFADRAAHLGDPDFVRVPTGGLLDPSYVERLRRSIDQSRATAAKDVKAGAFPPPEAEHTTHYSVVDAAGNAVSNTTTLNLSYGSGAVVKGAGFLLNNEMDDFAAKPGVPNAFGLLQGEANAIAARKRPLSSMTPTILLQDGRLLLVLGSPGGPTIINTVLQTILNVLDHGMSVSRAVAAPRFHHQWMPDEIRWEPHGLPADVRRAMEARGHAFAERGGSMGSCHAILVDPPSGHRLAGVDPRISGAGAAGR